MVAHAPFESFRLLDLTTDQLLLCILAGVINLIQLAFKVIAYQNERPGLITIIGYIGLLYGFLVDTFLMDEKFTGFEFLGVLIILVMNIIVIGCKKKDREDAGEDGDNAET
mmetsp:Transcript_31412/g.41607  ORF Transcript_31412/g.41607 Transcript_31412/m.41607 type:complete len:111 (-) Transcript_31412:24-356(-)